MTTAQTAHAAVPQPPQTRATFDPATIALHWITVALVVSLFAVGWSIDLAPDDRAARLLLTLHRSLGVTVWGVAVVRLGWRFAGARHPPFPQTAPLPQRLAARLNEYALYGLLLVQPATGVAQSLYRGKPFALFLWQLPRLAARDKVLVHQFHQLHEWGAWALAGLIGLHAAAALLHGLVLRDGVLHSMAPLRRSR